MSALSCLLPNGLELIGLSRPRSPITAVRLHLRVGSADEGERERGLAHVVEHLVVRCSMAGGRVDGGALVSAHTSREHTSYGVLVRTGALTPMLATLGAAFNELTVDQHTLAAELAAIRQERAQREQDVRWRLQESLLATLWQGTSYAHPVLGCPQVVDRLTPSVLSRFHAAHYRPVHATLVLVSERVRQDMGTVAAQAARWGSRPAAPLRRPPAPRRPTAVVTAHLPAGPRRVVGFAFAERADGGQHDADASGDVTSIAERMACHALARRAVRAAAGSAIGHLLLVPYSCTWIMVSAPNTGAATAVVRAALLSTQQQLLAPEGALWLRSEVLIPELRTGDDVEELAQRTAERPAELRHRSWQAELAAVPATRVAEVVQRWAQLVESLQVPEPDRPLTGTSAHAG